jgi:hypothetical protein
MFTFSDIEITSANDHLIAPDGYATPFAQRSALFQKLFGMTPVEFQRKYHAAPENAFISHGYVYVNGGSIQLEADPRGLTNDQIRLLLGYLDVIPDVSHVEVIVLQHDPQTYQLLNESPWYEGSSEGLKTKMLSAPTVTQNPGQEFQQSDVQYNYVPQRGGKHAPERPSKWVRDMGTAESPAGETSHTPTDVSPVVEPLAEGETRPVPAKRPTVRPYKSYDVKNEVEEEAHPAYTIRDRRGVKDYELWQSQQHRRRKGDLTFEGLRQTADMANLLDLRTPTEIELLPHKYYGMPVVKFDGHMEIALATDEQADRAVYAYIMDSLWASNADWLARYIPSLNEQSIKRLQESAEDSNDVLRTLLQNKKQFVTDTVNADGRGHFLSTYDGIEHTLDDYHLQILNLPKSVLQALRITRNPAEEIYVYVLND